VAGGYGGDDASRRSRQRRRAAGKISAAGMCRAGSGCWDAGASATATAHGDKGGGAPPPYRHRHVASGSVRERADAEAPGPGACDGMGWRPQEPLVYRARGSGGPMAGAAGGRGRIFLVRAHLPGLLACLLGMGQNLEEKR
jgi:hypothetical protein